MKCRVVSKAEWDTFISNQPKATSFHTWLRIKIWGIMETFRWLLFQKVIPE